MNVDDTLEFLLGRWSVHRSIVHADGRHATFRGMGVFTVQRCAYEPQRQRWAHYEERGSLRFDGSSSSATRQLDYTSGPEDRGVNICFSDVRHFISLDLSAGSWVDRHLCVADLYEISTRVLSPDVIEERWVV
ncbi:MAG: DUF6314 family protein, partial [Actinobacteria bacterium]|nr:DUF6314 family protein [Actinomycetota bacterium]